MKKINVAITLNIRKDPNQSIWFNGANQHCIFLYMLLKRSPVVRNVWLGHDVDITSYPSNMMLDQFKEDLKELPDVINRTDLLIEMNSYVGQDYIAVVRNRGGKCVSYRFGNDYVIAVECTNFARNNWLPNPGRIRVDEVWTNPQHMHTCASFFEAMARAPVFELPHLWSPYFIERALSGNPMLKKKWGYRPRGRAKAVGIFEPNLNVVKSTIIPMLACNTLFSRCPELVKHVYMTNTEALKENPTFKHIALGLEMVHAGRATADGRFPFVEFAAENLDAVISHQWENALNYLFYESLYGDYPLVHNSPMLGSAGYCYQGFDISGAADALELALTRHDENLSTYRKNAAAVLRTVDPFNPEVIAQYTSKIQRLFDGDLSS